MNTPVIPENAPRAALAIVQRYDGAVNCFHRTGDDQARERFVASWRGHAQWANTFNLLNRLGVAA